MAWRNKLLKIVEPELKKLDIAHQIDHSLRIYKICEKISKNFKRVNLDVLYAASLLHDIGYIIKYDNEHSHNSIKLAKRYLKKADFPPILYNLVEEAIRAHDNYIWVKNHSNKKPKSLEAKIFQDADRIENMGAIGIARNAGWAGKHNKVIYNEKIGWRDNVIFGGNISVVHTIKSESKAYENFNTRAAKKISKERYLFTKLFIKQILKEWK